MRLLRGFGTGILVSGMLLAAASVSSAQNSQGNGQQNGQQQNGNTGTSPANNNVPYHPPVAPPGGYGDAATGSYSGRSTSGGGSGGYGSGQGGTSGGYGSGQNTSSDGIGRISSALGVDDAPQTPQSLEMQQARARNAERQKQLVADAQKLVALANQLQDDVSKSNKDMLSLDVVRKAEEIDKLARTVRDRMRNAN
jgi:hypothetical protein